MFKWDQVSTNQTIPAPRTGLFGCVCVSGKFVLICPLLSLEREVFHLLWVEQWWSLQKVCRRRLANLPTFLFSEWKTPQMLSNVCMQEGNKMGEYQSSKGKLSSASGFLGGSWEQWENEAENKAVTPCANHLTGQQFSRALCVLAVSEPLTEGPTVLCPSSGPTG